MKAAGGHPLGSLCGGSMCQHDLDIIQCKAAQESNMVGRGANKASTHNVSNGFNLISEEWHRLYLLFWSHHI